MSDQKEASSGQQTKEKHPLTRRFVAKDSIQQTKRIDMGGGKSLTIEPGSILAASDEYEGQLGNRVVLVQPYGSKDGDGEQGSSTFTMTPEELKQYFTPMPAGNKEMMHKARAARSDKSYVVQGGKPGRRGSIADYDQRGDRAHRSEKEGEIESSRRGFSKMRKDFAEKIQDSYQAEYQDGCLQLVEQLLEMTDDQIDQLFNECDDQQIDSIVQAFGDAGIDINEAKEIDIGGEKIKIQEPKELVTQMLGKMRVAQSMAGARLQRQPGGKYTIVAKPIESMSAKQRKGFAAQLQGKQFPNRELAQQALDNLTRQHEQGMRAVHRVAGTGGEEGPKHTARAVGGGEFVVFPAHERNRPSSEDLQQKFDSREAAERAAAKRNEREQTSRTDTLAQRLSQHITHASGGEVKPAQVAHTAVGRFYGAELPKSHEISQKTTSTKPGSTVQPGGRTPRTENEREKVRQRNLKLPAAPSPEPKVRPPESEEGRIDPFAETGRAMSAKWLQQQLDAAKGFLAKGRGSSEKTKPAVAGGKKTPEVPDPLRLDKDPELARLRKASLAGPVPAAKSLATPEQVAGKATKISQKPKAVKQPKGKKSKGKKSKATKQTPVEAPKTTAPKGRVVKQPVDYGDKLELQQLPTRRAAAAASSITPESQNITQKMLYATTPLRQLAGTTRGTIGKATPIKTGTKKMNENYIDHIINKDVVNFSETIRNALDFYAHQAIENEKYGNDQDSEDVQQDDQIEETFEHDQQMVDQLDELMQQIQSMDDDQLNEYIENLDDDQLNLFEQLIDSIE